MRSDEFDRLVRETTETLIRELTGRPQRAEERPAAMLIVQRALITGYKAAVTEREACAKIADDAAAPAIAAAIRTRGPR
jgi:hypothetical protein